MSKFQKIVKKQFDKKKFQNFKISKISENPHRTKIRKCQNFRKLPKKIDKKKLQNLKIIM